VLPFSIVQVMSHSMVSPGFWCQAPKALVPHIGAQTKDVWFETTDRLCGTDATDFRVRSAGNGRFYTSSYTHAAVCSHFVSGLFEACAILPRRF
jgi:hypothetical protein